MSDFDALVAAINHGFVSPDHLPALSLLKAPGYQDGHAAYSDPLDEQDFIVREINALEHTPDWSSTAVVIAYDDFRRLLRPRVSAACTTRRTRRAWPTRRSAGLPQRTGLCGKASDTPLAGQNGRCGYGPRLPLLVISPWAGHGHIDHTFTDQSSIIKFVEDNWHLPRIAGSFDAKGRFAEPHVRLRRITDQAAVPRSDHGRAPTPLGLLGQG